MKSRAKKYPRIRLKINELIREIQALFFTILSLSLYCVMNDCWLIITYQKIPVGSNDPTGVLKNKIILQSLQVKSLDDVLSWKRQIVLDHYAEYL